MNREEVAMDLTVQNVEILRGRLEQAELALQAIAYLPIAEQDDMPAANMRAIAKQFLASQQGEQAKLCTKPDCFPHCDCGSADDKHPKQAEGAQGERQAFEAHESRERRLSPADQKFWFRRGAVADYDIKSIDDAWKAWKARAALAQPALQCKKCGGTGDADSGGIHPWGEAAMVPCDCAHTERAQGKRTEDGDTVIDRLRLGGLTIDGDNAYKRDLLDCVVGALAFGFQGRPAPEETHWLHRFWEIGNAEREARAALAQPSPAEDMSAAQELAGVKAILNDMADALKRLTFHARTTGGTAGPDAALMNACERAERILSLGGMGAAFMRGCDEHESQPSPAAPELEAPTSVGVLILGGAVSSTELGDNDVTLDGQVVERIQRELVSDSEDVAVELMIVGQHYRILQVLRAERDVALAAVAQLHSMLGVTDQVQAGERLGFLVGQSIMVPKLEAQLKRSTVYIEARQCDECQHGGINDSAYGLAACHDCDWTGPDPAEDKCPGCHSENCMAAACPQCGARYVLVASEEIAAPVAQAGQVPEGKIVVSEEPLRRLLHALSGEPHLIRELQATRHPAALFKDNPINVLVAEYNAAPPQGGE